MGLYSSQPLVGARPPYYLVDVPKQAHFRREPKNWRINGPFNAR